MDDRKVLVKNISQHRVVLAVPTSNFRHEFRGEDTKAMVPFDVLYEALIGEPGTKVLFDEGFLYIDSEQDRIDLGLEDEDAENSSKVLSSKKMLEILNENDAVKIKKVLTELPAEQKNKFVDVAVENGIYTPGLAKIIKDLTGVDLLVAIKNAQEEE